MTSVFTCIFFRCLHNARVEKVRSFNNQSNDIIIIYPYYLFRLRIKSLEPRDTGHYTCWARNSFGEVNTTGYLEVKNGKQYSPRL